MRRPRHKLHVSTFPFLAVLLCAMGALILFLLVMDRRAKLVAQNKARDVHDSEAAQLAQRAKEDEARKAEWEKLRDALHQTLLAQKRELEGEATQVQHQFGNAGKTLDAKQAELEAMKSAVAASSVKLVQHQGELNSRQLGLKESDKQVIEATADLKRLNIEVADLERVLAELQALKKLEKQTYSLVPYRGKNGDNRNPIYIECVKNSLIFHPDRTTLAGIEFTANDLRGEVERRAGKLEREIKTKSKKDELPGPPRGPYVLFLIRPDGIASYYQALAYLKGFQVDFGYEVVDQHWLLDFGTASPFAGSPLVGAPPAAPPRAGTITVKPTPIAPLEPSPLLPPSAVIDFPMPGPPGGPGGVPSIGGTGPNLAGNTPPGGAGLWTGPGGTNPALPGSVGVPGIPASETGIPGTKAPGVSWPPQGPSDTVPGAISGVGTSSPGVSAKTISGTGLGNGPGSSGPGLPGIGMPDQLAPGAPGFGSALGGNGPAFPSAIPGASAPGPNIPGVATPGMATFPPPLPNEFGSKGPITVVPKMVPFAKSPMSTEPQESAPMPLVKAGPGLPIGGVAPPPFVANSPPAANPGLPPAFKTPPSAGTPGLPNLEGTPSPQSHGPDGPPQKPTLPSIPGPTTGGSGESGPPSLSPPGLATPGLGTTGGKKPAKISAPPGVVLGNRDFLITITCFSDHVTVYPGGRQHWWKAGTAGQTDKALVKSVQDLIIGRQKAVQSGEPPYRPIIRFQLAPDGLGSYLHAYPLLTFLQVPMTRENLEE